MSDIIDSHIHIWDLERFTYKWPTSKLNIYRNYLPDDLASAAADTPVREFIFVQGLNDCPEEAKWVMSLARSNPSIKGIVAGLDPSHIEFEDRLQNLKEEVPLLVGIRHIPDFDPRPDYISRDDVAEGIKVLGRHNLTYDLLIRPHTIQAASTLVSKNPEVKFVIDHIALPNIAEGGMDPWRHHLEDIAQYQNVYCKLSGMITRADLVNWKPEHLQPFVEHVLRVFGCDRVMYGSDWPICEMARNTDYATVFSTLKKLVEHIPEDETRKIFCANARNFYNIA
ncbi:hypothetical protein SK128_024507 [Halocaridina rubra]|uniref:Amidohydrolase-related domain-containing protein n=1 Tax=Halocaridina rubra TaxID=373956 RepID=A0AAN8ZX05_HALRR